MTLQLGEKHFSSAQPESAARRIVTFKVGDRTFGIDVGMVREIKGWQATTPLPHAAPHVRGVLNLRGVILAGTKILYVIGREAFGDFGAARFPPRCAGSPVGAAAHKEGADNVLPTLAQRAAND